MMLVELLVEADLPNGVPNIVHGTNEIINAICDGDDIKDISFLGLSTARSYVYFRALSKGKCVQCNIGAKNHTVVMPDASMDTTLNALVTTDFGGVGQKRMALNTVFFVGGLTPCKREK